ncbi:MAG: DUF4238 domain-containing protein [Clostridia bacterium]|nr:DUF4238 domain-containing protein [Clostridia bacterium]
MNKQSIKHHHVPQFFLNNFGVYQKNNTYTINVFNKNTLKSFHNSVSNVAYLKKFHTIKINGNEDDFFENAHNIFFEKSMSRKYKRIVDKLDLILKSLYCYNCLNDIENFFEIHQFELNGKMFISRMLAYFIQRSKKYRMFGEASYDKSCEMFNMVGKAHNLSDEDIKNSITEQIGNKEDVKKSQLIRTFKGDSIPTLAKYLYLHTWNICFNLTNIEFYSNDTVHGLTTICKDWPPIYGIGYTSLGNVVFFPLTPRITIIMYDTVYIRKNNVNIIDCNYVKLKEEDVYSVNEEMIYSAVDEVYSKNGDWSFLNTIYKKGKISKGDKPYSIN